MRSASLSGVPDAPARLALAWAPGGAGCPARPISPCEFVATPRGVLLTVRPVEPGDGPAVQDYVRSLSPAARRNRFLGAVSELPATEMAKIVGPASGRCALVVEIDVDGRPMIVGEARLAFDPEAQTCEFGLSIRDDHQHQGLGAALLTAIVGWAARLGAASVFGDTFATNEAMLGLARSLGFRLRRNPADPRLVRMEKTVAADHAPAAGAAAAPSFAA